MEKDLEDFEKIRTRYVERIICGRRFEDGS
jgi:hypothetical protein